MIVARPYHPAAVRLTVLCAAVAGLLGSAPATAVDARTYALGGSTVADGRGAHGALQNPASLVAMQRRGERFHLQLGAAVDARDHAGLIDIARDDANEDLADDLDAEIDRLSGSALACDLAQDPPDDTVCVTGTDRLADLAGDARRLLDDVDGEPVSGLASLGAGFAFTGTGLPFALHAGARGTVRARADVGAGDRAYVDSLSRALRDGLTAGEIRDGELAAQARYDVQEGTITFTDPAEIIASTADTATLVRTQLAVSIGSHLTIGTNGIDIGVTPKFSRLTAYGRTVELSDAFDEAAESLGDQIEGTETEESSFTVDVGMSTALTRVPVRVAAVIRNLLPESIETDTGFRFDTDAQLVVGAHLQAGIASITADAAVNEADVDGIATQPVALGLELGNGLFAARLGLGADLGRDDDETALSAGVKLGPLEIGGRITGVERGQFGAQLAFSF